MLSLRERSGFPSPTAYAPPFRRSTRPLTRRILTEREVIDLNYLHKGSTAASIPQGVMNCQAALAAGHGYVNVTRRVAEATGYVYHAC